MKFGSIARKKDNLYYRMEVTYEGHEFLSHYMKISMATSISRRAANDFVRTARKSRLVNRQNKKELADTNLILDMLTQAVSNIQKLALYQVMVEITGTDCRRTKVYKYLLDKKGYQTYLSPLGELYLVL